MLYPFFQSPNFSLRAERKIDAIILHRTLGNAKKTIKRAFDPGSLESYHFLIARKGKIVQLVREQDVAWHTGWITNQKIPQYLKPNPNAHSLGIVLEDSDVYGFAPLWSSEQKEAFLCLLKNLTLKYKIPIEPNFILSHSLIDPRRNPNDPGGYINWNDVFGLKRRKKSQNLKKPLALEKKKSKIKEEIKTILKKDEPKLSQAQEEKRIQMIREVFLGVLERLPNISELDYYRYSSLTFSEIINRLTRSKEFWEKRLRKMVNK